MRLLRFLKPLLAVGLVAGLAAASYVTRHNWLPLLKTDKSAVSDGPSSGGTEAAASTGQVLLSDQAIANLGLRAKAAQPGTYWQTIQVPGMVLDRPGRSDRGVVSPVTGV